MGLGTRPGAWICRFRFAGEQVRRLQWTCVGFIRYRKLQFGGGGGESLADGGFTARLEKDSYLHLGQTSDHGRTQPSGKGGGRNFIQGGLTSRKIMDYITRFGRFNERRGEGVLSASGRFNERGGGCPRKVNSSGVINKW